MFFNYQELEIVMGDQHISFTMSKMSMQECIEFCLYKTRTSKLAQCCGGSRGGSGGSGGSVEPPKLNVKTYNKRVVKKKTNSANKYIF